jgi:pimeloyl-ACP methyl ester carboxylesterase
VTALTATDVIEVDGARLEYDLAGAGEPVVLLHPGLWDRRTWDAQFGVFSRAYRVLRYDARGCGRSSRIEPGDVYSHVDDLVAVMDAVGCERAALVGCSMGGGTALDCSLVRPERVTALILVTPGVSGTDEGTPEEESWFAERWEPIESLIGAGDLEAAMDVCLRSFWATLGTDDPAGARVREIAFGNLHALTMDESGERGIDPPAYARLEDVAAPTLVFPADHDPPYARRVYADLGERIPGARVARIPDVDHVVNLRKPAEFDAAVLDFLSDVL